MLFTVVLICLLFQWFVNLDGKYRHNLWFSECYRKWLRPNIDKMKVTNAWGRVILAVLPGVIVAALLGAILHALWGNVACFIFSVVVLWFCVDFDGVKSRAKKSGAAKGYFALAFGSVFAPIFWFGILGVSGAVLYYLVAGLRQILLVDEQVDGDTQSASLTAVIQLQGVLDWVPLRLLGLTFALVGQFGPTFSQWFKELLTGIKHTHEQAEQWGATALGTFDGEGDQLPAALMMVDRALLVWIVVLALFSIGAWVG